MRASVQHSPFPPPGFESCAILFVKMKAVLAMAQAWGALGLPAGGKNAAPHRRWGTEDTNSSRVPGVCTRPL